MGPGPEELQPVPIRRDGLECISESNLVIWSVLQSLKGLEGVEGVEGLERLERLERRSWVFVCLFQLLTFKNPRNNKKTGLEKDIPYSCD